MRAWHGPPQVGEYVARRGGGEGGYPGDCSPSRSVVSNTLTRVGSRPVAMSCLVGLMFTGFGPADMRSAGAAARPARRHRLAATGDAARQGADMPDRAEMGAMAPLWGRAGVGAKAETATHAERASGRTRKVRTILAAAAETRQLPRVRLLAEAGPQVLPDRCKLSLWMRSEC